MKLVKINDDMILDLEDVQFAIWDKEYKRVLIGFKSNRNSVSTTNKKVLDAIYGSEEHSVSSKVSTEINIEKIKEYQQLLKDGKKQINKLKKVVEQIENFEF
jgi:hypothetical protein